MGSRLILITFSPPSEPNNSFWNPTSNPDFPFNVVYIFDPYIIYFQVNTTEKKNTCIDLYILQDKKKFNFHYCDKMLPHRDDIPNLCVHVLC